MEACHEDGDPLNNKLSNLRWDTSQSNSADMVRHGRSNRGEKHPLVKLKKRNIPAIRKRLKADESQQSIAASYGVSQGCISAIHTGKTWSHVK